MKAKLCSMLTLILVLVAHPIFAQQTMITGTVTDDQGLPLPGVNVVIQGSDTGVQTDFDGNYAIEAQQGDVLVFSFVGMQTAEYTVNNETTINLTLSTDSAQLDEVVVTALGIKRDKKSLGFAQQSITGDNVIQAKDTDINSALAGKVAGVQLVGSPSSSFNNALIRLRGETDVLFVVDGIKINNPSDINVEDIEDISVLKGIAGTALYGTEARNGAVIITTKSAKNGQMKITIDEAFSFSNLYLLPEYQNEYGGGYSQTFSELNGELIPNYAADESWGPALDGTLVRHWDSWIEGSDTYGELRPWSPNPDNVRDFYETGVTNNVTATLLKGGEDYNIKATINNLNTQLIYPNTDREQSTISLKTSYNVSDKLTFNGNFNYQYRKTFNNPYQGYGSIASNFNQWWQRQLDIDRLKNYNQNGQIYSWNLKSANDATPLYWNSPYFDVYENVNNETKNAVYGSIGLDYEFNENLSAMVDLRRTFTLYNYDDRNAWYGLELPYYREYTSQRGFTELYTQVNYEKNIGDFDLVATAGGQWFQRTYKYINAESVGGLQISNYYSIDTSVDNPNYTRDSEDIKNYSGFITASLGYKDMIFVDGSFRREWGSTASVDDNSVNVFGISGSFIFSELLDNNDFLTFGKLRAGFAQAPSFPEIYQLNQTYTIGDPYNGSTGALVSTYTPNDLPNSNLQGGVREEQELGLEMRFLNSRLGLDLTYYHREDKELPTQVTLNGASGYTATFGNEAYNKTNGWEVGLTGTPIKTEDFTWDAIFNIAGYRKTVEKVSSTSTSNTIASAWGGYVNNNEGEDYGNIYGVKWLRGENGEYVYNSAGVRQYTNQIEKIGNIQPDFTGGMINNIYYKNFSLNFSIDFQKGGDFYSISRRFNASSGVGDMTVGNNNLGNKIRSGLQTTGGTTPVDSNGEPVNFIEAELAGPNTGGVYVEGVSPEGEQVSYYVDARSYFGNISSAPEEWIYDASYVKLRQMRIGYTFPKPLIENLPFDEIYVGAYANNLWLIYSEVDGIDPSELESYEDDSSLDLRWQEGGQSPSQRTFGMNVRVSF